MTLCLHNFAVTAQAKNVQKKTVLLVLVVVVVYQNAKVLFKLNVMERVKTGIGLFKFLKNNMEKRRWVNIISMYWRKEQVTTQVLMMNPKSTLFVNTTSLNVMERVKTGIGLFKFLKDNMEKRRWVNIISMYWRKGAGDNSSPYDESEKYFFVNTTSKQTRYVLA